MPDPQSLPIGINAALFFVAAVLIWMAGTRLARFADSISDRTGLGEAFVGVLFLAVATSLPDSASVITSASAGDASLSVNNLLGGIALQTTILVVADYVSGGKALTHFIAQSVLLLEGLIVVILLGVTLTGIGIGDTSIGLGIGVWPLTLALIYIIGLYLVRIYNHSEQWKPVDLEDEDTEEPGENENEKRFADWSNTKLYLAFAAGAAVILVAGTVIGRTGDALASQTGLGGSFTGTTLLALATSLPDLSTTISAARLGAYTLAVSNVFGGTMLLPAILFPADIAYRSGPILSEIGRDAILAAGAGLVVTAIYLVGLIERRDRTIGRIGVDSVAVLIVYALSLVGQFLLR